MIALTLKLLLAHLLGDFVFQSDKWVEGKRKKKQGSPYLYWHVGIHLILLIILLEFQNWKSIGIIVSTHWLIDLIKLHLENKRNSILLFVLDQLTHLLVIFVVVYINHPFKIDFDIFNQSEVLLFLIAIVSVSYVAAVLMKMILGNWQMDESRQEGSLANAGKYIGMLERLFIFGFILFQQWQAIGLLIAAKSVFRFNDLTRAKDRRLTEYILIGTLLSFGLAVVVALLYQAVLLLINDVMMG